MNIRESMEQREQKMLSPYAALSLCSRGRESGRRKNAMYGLSIRETGTGSFIVKLFAG